MPGTMAVQAPDTKKPLNGAVCVNAIHCIDLCSSGRGWLGNQDVAGVGASSLPIRLFDGVNDVPFLAQPADAWCQTPAIVEVCSFSLR